MKWGFCCTSKRVFSLRMQTVLNPKTLLNGVMDLSYSIKISFLSSKCYTLATNVTHVSLAFQPTNGFIEENIRKFMAPTDFSTFLVNTEASEI